MVAKQYKTHLNIVWWSCSSLHTAVDNEMGPIQYDSCAVFFYTALCLPTYKSIICWVNRSSTIFCDYSHDPVTRGKAYGWLKLKIRFLKIHI